MFTFFLITQILLALGLTVLILLQQGKGADVGAAFGSGASSTVFGSQGSANFLSRSSAILAALFFVNSLALSSAWVLGDRQPTSVAEQLSGSVTQTVDEQSQQPGDLPALPAESAPPATDLPE